MKQVIFIAPPGVQLLDFAGPVQVFDEARGLGAAYRLRYGALGSHTQTAQKICLSQMEPFQTIEIQPDDIVFIAGICSDQLHPSALAALGDSFYAWLRKAHQNGALLCSVCTATFLLAHSGLLQGRKCTTHWSLLADLAAKYQDIEVLPNRLFVKDGPFYSSAGISSGIDLALSIIEADLGPSFTAKVAQMLVVYLRRDSSHDQTSIFLDYRDHLDARIHRVQDLVIQNISHQQTIDALAAEVFMSPRHLTRLFKKETGLTLKTYATRIRMAKAEQLLAQPGLAIEAIAHQCGFEDARQFRRLWQNHKGCSPSRSRGQFREHGHKRDK